MKKIFILFILFYLFIINNIFSESIYKENLKKIAVSVINSLNSQNKNELSKFLSKDIKLETLSKSEIQKLADKLLEDEISIEYYMIKITGNNLKFFIENCKILSYKIILIDKESRYDGAEAIFFIKMKLDYKYRKKTFKNVDLELDFKKENNKFSLIGFII